MVIWHLDDGGPPIEVPIEITIEKIRKAVRHSVSLLSPERKVQFLILQLNRGLSFREAMDAAKLRGPGLYQVGRDAYLAWRDKRSVED